MRPQNIPEASAIATKKHKSTKEEEHFVLFVPLCGSLGHCLQTRSGG